MKGRHTLLAALLCLAVGTLCGAQLSGNYTIDPNGSGPTNYTTFAAAAQALSAGVSGPVVFRVASTTFNESVSLPAVTGVSSTNTVTFVATGARRPESIEDSAGAGSVEFDADAVRAVENTLPQP